VLTGELNIPGNIDVMLVSGHDTALGEGPFMLIGANNHNVIFLQGVLTLDGGIIVTHAEGDAGRGIWVATSGELNIFNGKISGNTVADEGGGIYLEGRLNMYAGSELSGNTARDGGGLYISGKGSGETKIFGGLISDNTATDNGGGIWVGRNNLNKLMVGAGVVFSGNRASKSYEIHPADKKTYEKQLGNNGAGVTWTGTFVQGYNNYDISYFWGDQLYTVVFDPRNGTPKTGFEERFVMRGASLGANMPPAPARAGYTFVCWRTEKDGKGSVFTAKTAVSGHITVYAEWKAIANESQKKPEEEDGEKITENSKGEQTPNKKDFIIAKTPEKKPPNDKPPVVKPPTDETPSEESPPMSGPAAEADVEPEPYYNTEPVMTRNKGLTPGVVLERLKDAGVPILVLGNREVPMHYYADLPVWAPINLILAAVGVVLAVSFVTQGFKSRKREDEYKRRDWRKFLVVILGAAGIILFILTEDTRNLIILFDRWTALNAVIFAAELVAIKLASSKRDIEQKLFY